ncbi:MAG: beta-lactamase family protein [Armatimonadetes bacterium]|nr:beta-lactamase family protein [Armatimonadota bacterium]
MGEGFQADAAAFERMDAYIASEMERQPFPGLALALVQDGTLVRAKGYGSSSLELNTPVHPDTVFQIGSLTKQFTAAGILLLWEAGRLDLDARIGAYLSGLPEAWEPLTLRHLLVHTSGLENVTGLDAFTYRKEYTKDELLDLLADQPVGFEPGERWDYSNTNYVLLAWIIEAVSGQSYGEFLHERIFAPLHMEDTRVIAPDEIVPRRAAGYCKVKGGYCKGEPHRPQVIVGAGGLLSTVLDLAKWDAALHGDFPLSSRLKREMWTPARLSDSSFAQTGLSCGEHYGFGWFLGDYRGHREVSHTGETDAGFNSEIFRLLDDRITVILLSNVEPMEQDRLTKGIIDRCRK